MLASAVAQAEMTPPSMDVPNAANSPVKKISGAELQQLSKNLTSLFSSYKSDRRLAELRWMRNERQYLGVYDPEMDAELSSDRSRSYPRLTRSLVISVLSRLMNLMFQGNERNWEIKAQPWPEMTMNEMAQAMADAQKADHDKGLPPQTELDIDYIMGAVQEFADKRAFQMSHLIDDQLQELGGSQKKDYVALNRAVLRSGIIYGMGVLRGPFARESSSVVWNFDNPQQPVPRKTKIYKPMFEFLSIWNFYPDMSAKTLDQMDGYFVRLVFSRSQLRDLADREDFLGDQIKEYLKNHSVGNYKAEWYEAELRAMGVKANVNEQKPETTKYEVLCWHGKITGSYLAMAGVEVPDNRLADDIDAEVWMIDGNIIKCIMNPWRELNIDMPMIHTFLFDEDDTSPVGSGLPSAIRDSQMGLCAATRMLMDNASVTCGPSIEINTDILRPDQDMRNIASYKVWYRTGEGPDAQFPAIREIKVDSHMTELMQVIELHRKNAEMESFVGPSTGGDMSHAPSEPFRTAAGASMLKGDAALPFKDMIRSFDGLTQSVIYAMVQFNREFNPELAPMADYDIVARGATSLMAKELRGMNADALAATLKPQEEQEIDMRKLALARLKARDMDDILVTPAESNRRAAAKQQSDAAQQDQLTRSAEATIRKILADAYKDIAGGQKNIAQADATSVDSAQTLLERGIASGIIQSPGMGGDTPSQPGVPADGTGNGPPSGPAPLAPPVLPGGPG